MLPRPSALLRLPRTNRDMPDCLPRIIRRLVHAPFLPTHPISMPHMPICCLTFICFGTPFLC